MKRKKKPIKINTNWTQNDVEDLAAEIAWMQDAGDGCNFRKKDEQITIKRGTAKSNTEQRPQVTEMEIHGYQKHWFESTQTGWQIRIATDNELFKINCHFADRVRTSDGRLLKK